MYRGGSRIVPIVILLVVVAIAIIGLVAVGRTLLKSNPQVQEPAENPATKALLTTDADYSVRMTVRGPIIGDEDFRSYQVTISPSSRQLVSYSGYDKQILENKQYANDLEAYTQFVYALGRANFTKGVSLTDEQNDTKGVCATGRLYTFEILEAQSVSKEWWTSSCRSLSGSFRGDAVLIRSLFLRQIPDSNDVLRKIDLSA